MKLALLFAAAAALLTACGSDYSDTQIGAVVTSFSGASTNQSDTIDERHITITEGHIVKAHIEVHDDDNENMSVVVKSQNTGIMDVHYVVNPNDFAFIATNVGTTEIQIIGDDVLRLTINATVVPQPTSE